MSPDVRLLHFLMMEWRGEAFQYSAKKNRQSFIGLYHFLVVMQKSVTATSKITSLIIMIALQLLFGIAL